MMILIRRNEARNNVTEYVIKRALSSVCGSSQSVRSTLWSMTFPAKPFMEMKDRKPRSCRKPYHAFSLQTVLEVVPTFNTRSYSISKNVKLHGEKTVTSYITRFVDSLVGENLTIPWKYLLCAMLAVLCFNHLATEAFALDEDTIESNDIFEKPIVISELRDELEEEEDENQKAPIRKRSSEAVLWLSRLISLDWIHLIFSAIGSLCITLLEIKLQRLFGALMDVIKEGSGFQNAVPSLVTFGVVVVIQALIKMGYLSLLTTGVENIATRLRLSLFQDILEKDISFFDDLDSNRLLTQVDSDVVEVRTGIKSLVSMGVSNMSMLVGGIASLYMLSPELTFAIGLGIPVVVGIGSIYGRLLRSLSGKMKSSHAASVSRSNESVQNITTVRSYANEVYETEGYNGIVSEHKSDRRLFGISLSVFRGLTSLAVNGIVFGVVGYGAQLVSDGTVTSGDLTSYLVTALRFQKCLEHLTTLWIRLLKANTSLDRLYSLSSNNNNIRLKGGIVPEQCLGHVEFDNVSFFYPSRPTQKVLDSFSLDVPSSYMCSLVGRSGAGKSTVVSLMERFYEPSEGSIYLDGVDIKELDYNWYRKQIGFVSQEPVLFQTSILENIAYGKMEATREEIEEAAKLANCHDFIANFPDGYLTKVGPRGVQLSGGQKQRISIARAILKDPKILILDEATSALDSVSESIVQKALNNLMKNRTVIVIAHRLSTVKEAHAIVVLEKGVIVENGDHKSLMGKMDGVYREFVEHQSLRQKAEVTDEW